MKFLKSLQKRLQTYQTRFFEWRVFKRRQRDFLRWAKAVSKNPKGLEVVNTHLIYPGYMQSELGMAILKGNKKAVIKWRELMHIKFAKLFHENVNNMPNYLGNLGDSIKKDLPNDSQWRH